MLLAPAQACVYSIEARADDEARLAEGWRGWWSRGDWGASSSTRGRPCRRPHVHPWRPASARTDQNIPGIQGADTARFDTLFERCERQVYGYLYRVLGDRQVAADLCQETFLRAWRHRERVAEYSEPLGWLLRVATNLALNHRRHGRTRVGVPVALSEENSPALGDPAPEVVEHLQVHQVLLALPANMRAALVLREVYGLELDEVARTLGISHGAAKMLLSRARERFRERYRREEGRE